MTTRRWGVNRQTNKQTNKQTNNKWTSKQIHLLICLSLSCVWWVGKSSRCQTAWTWSLRLMISHKHRWDILPPSSLAFSSPPRPLPPPPPLPSSAACHRQQVWHDLSWAQHFWLETNPEIMVRTSPDHITKQYMSLLTCMLAAGLRHCPQCWRTSMGS